MIQCIKKLNAFSIHKKIFNNQKHFHSFPIHFNTNNNNNNNNDDDDDDELELEYPKRKNIQILYFWIKLQRMERKKLERIVEYKYNDQTTANTMTSTLTQEHIQSLNELELDWDPRICAWDRTFRNFDSLPIQTFLVHLYSVIIKCDYDFFKIMDLNIIQAPFSR